MYKMKGICSVCGKASNAALSGGPDNQPITEYCTECLYEAHPDKAEAFKEAERQIKELQSPKTLH